LPIRLRLALIVAVATSLLVAAGGTVFAAALSSGMRRTLEDSLLRSSARLVTEISAGHIRLGVGSPAVDPARDQSVVQVMSSLGRLQFTTVRAGTSSLLTARQRDHAAAARIFVQSVRPGWRNPRLVLAEPVPGEKGYLLAVGASLDELDNAMSRLEDLLAIGGTAFVVLASLGGLVLAGRALRPVERLRQEAAQLSASLPEDRLAVPRTHDEVARLAVTLNSLLDRLQKALSREREFIAVASHELRTPLAVLQAELDIARRPGRSNEELARSLEVLGPKVELLSELADELLLLARADEGALGLHKVPQTLEPLVARGLLSLAPVADSAGLVLALDADADVTAAVDAGRFHQVVDNLVGNAIEHASGSAVVQVQVRREADAAVIEVRDQGPGFPEEMLPRVFERFTRAAAGRQKRAGAGAGLGLAIVKRIVEAHGGTVEARNLEQGGASVLVRLPASEQRAREPSFSDPGSTTWGGLTCSGCGTPSSERDASARQANSSSPRA
jgi:two-component system OmpR family sensor kinase